MSQCNSFFSENNGRNLLALRTTTDLETPPQSPFKQQTETCGSDELESDEKSESNDNDGTELKPRKQQRSEAFETLSTSIGELLEPIISRPAMSARMPRIMQPLEVNNTPRTTVAEIHEEPVSRSG